MTVEMGLVWVLLVERILVEVRLAWLRSDLSQAVGEPTWPESQTRPHTTGI